MAYTLTEKRIRALKHIRAARPKAPAYVLVLERMGLVERRDGRLYTTAAGERALAREFVRRHEAPLGVLFQDPDLPRLSWVVTR